MLRQKMQHRILGFLVFLLLVSETGDADMSTTPNAVLQNLGFVSFPLIFHPTLSLKMGDNKRNWHLLVAENLVKQLVVGWL